MRLIAQLDKNMSVKVVIDLKKEVIKKKNKYATKK